MKSLIYIPIIHEDVDLGSLAAAARKKGLEICGNAVWERHKETVRLFWKRIEQFLKSIDANDLEIFQDGLPAEGHMGLKIIQEGAKRGSRNHQIVLDLIHRGATLKKTEDIELLKEELERSKRLSGAGERQNDLAPEEDLACGKNLMVKRDRIVAQNINRHLKQRGVLFMGAFHTIIPQLDKTISINELKSVKKVQEYLLTLYRSGPAEKHRELSDYLAAPLCHHSLNPIAS